MTSYKVVVYFAHRTFELLVESHMIRSDIKRIVGKHFGLLPNMFEIQIYDERSRCTIELNDEYYAELQERLPRTVQAKLTGEITLHNSSNLGNRRKRDTEDNDERKKRIVPSSEPMTIVLLGTSMNFEYLQTNIRIIHPSAQLYRCDFVHDCERLFDSFLQIIPTVLITTDERYSNIPASILNRVKNIFILSSMFENNSTLASIQFVKNEPDLLLQLTFLMNKLSIMNDDKVSNICESTDYPTRHEDNEQLDVLLGMAVPVEPLHGVLREKSITTLAEHKTIEPLRFVRDVQPYQRMQYPSDHFSCQPCTFQPSYVMRIQAAKTENEKHRRVEPIIQLPKLFQHRKNVSLTVAIVSEKREAHKRIWFLHTSKAFLPDSATDRSSYVNPIILTSISHQSRSERLFELSLRMINIPGKLHIKKEGLQFYELNEEKIVKLHSAQHDSINPRLACVIRSEEENGSFIWETFGLSDFIRQKSNANDKQSSTTDTFVTNSSNQQIGPMENAFKDVTIVRLQEHPDRRFFYQDFQHYGNFHRGQYDSYQHVFYIGCQEVPISIINLYTFDDCLDYVQTRENKKILLIIPNALSEEKLSNVKKYSQIHLIYELDSQTHWITRESDGESSLFILLLNQVKQLCDRIINDTTMFYSITEQAVKAPLQDIDNDSRTFIVYQLLIEIILYSKITENSRNDFMTYADEMFSKKGCFLKDIEEFKSSFRPERAIHWYTRSSFVYRILSYTCCSNNIQNIFKVRYFIGSLCDELRKHHSESLLQYGDKLEVYRGKQMANDEFLKLQKSIGNLFTTSTFLSTTIDRSVALMYAGEDRPEGTVGVIFRIIIDTVTNRTKPFAHIASQSHFSDENEVLISIGAIFKSLSIDKITEYIWEVTLKRDFEEEILEQTLLNQHLNTNTENRTENIGLMVDFLQNDRDGESCIKLTQRLYDRLRSFTSTTTDGNEETIRKEQGALLTETAPVPSSTEQMTIEDNITPLRGSSIDIHPNARWQQKGLTVAGGNGEGIGINQLYYPFGLYVDDDQTVYVADHQNHRIVKWKSGATSGQVVAGGNGQRSEAHQLPAPSDVIVDKERDSLIICDPSSNGRVIQWPRRNGTSGETIISNINCMGLTLDENGSLYATDAGKHEVRRYRRGESQGTVVAGGNGEGNRLDQLSNPHHVFVDRDHSVYVSEYGNGRVMKWMEGAKQGIVVAGGQGRGNGLTQLSRPQGVVVDQLGTIYVADDGNHRIMRWPKGAIQGSVTIGGNGGGGQSNQLNHPVGLSFDRHGNLYVVDCTNHRVQKFNIENS